MTSTNVATRQWLKKKQIFHKDICEILGDLGVKYPEQDFKNFTEKDFKELKRRAEVANNKFNANDPKKKKNLENILKKLKTLWRGISGKKEKTGMGKNKSSSKKKSTNPKEKKQKLLDSAGELKQWMKKNGVFMIEIFEALAEVAGIIDKKTLSQMTWKQFDEVERKAKVDRERNTQDMDSRKQFETKFIKFRKTWVSEFNIPKRTMKTSKTNKKVDLEKERKEEQKEREQLVRPLVEWMRKNEVFTLEIKEALIEIAGITNPQDFKSMTWKQYKEVERVAVVKRNHNTQDQNSRKLLLDKLTALKKTLKSEFGVSEESMMTGNTNKKEDNKNKEDERVGFLTRWLKANGCYDDNLKDELIKRDVYGSNDLGKITKIKDICQMIRVNRFSELKDQQSRNRLDVKLMKFEKLWKSVTGNKGDMGFGKKN